MAQNTARQGARFENQIRGDLERFGYVTMRSAASKGAVDVVAFGEGEVLLIQAKVARATIPPAEREAVLELARRSAPVGVPLVATKDGPRTLYRMLTGSGPKEWEPWIPEPVLSTLCFLCGHGYGVHAPDGCWSGARCLCAEFRVRPAKGA